MQVASPLPRRRILQPTVYYDHATECAKCRIRSTKLESCLLGIQIVYRYMCKRYIYMYILFWYLCVYVSILLVTASVKPDTSANILDLKCILCGYHSG